MQRAPEYKHTPANVHFVSSVSLSVREVCHYLFIHTDLEELELELEEQFELFWIFKTIYSILKH